MSSDTTIYALKEKYRSIDNWTNLLPKNIDKIEDLPFKHKEALIDVISDYRPDHLLEKMGENSDKKLIHSLLLKNVDLNILNILKRHPNLTKQETIEQLINLNPLHKDEVLSLVKETIENEFDFWKENFTSEELNERLINWEESDLKELQSLSEKRSIDQIKTINSVNRSHNQF